MCDLLPVARIQPAGALPVARGKARLPASLRATWEGGGIVRLRTQAAHGVENSIIVSVTKISPCALLNSQTLFHRTRRASHSEMKVGVKLPQQSLCHTCDHLSSSLPFDAVCVHIWPISTYWDS